MTFCEIPPHHHSLGAWDREEEQWTRRQGTKVFTSALRRDYGGAGKAVISAPPSASAPPAVCAMWSWISYSVSSSAEWGGCLQVGKDSCSRSMENVKLMPSTGRRLIRLCHHCWWHWVTRPFSSSRSALSPLLPKWGGRGHSFKCQF